MIKKLSQLKMLIFVVTLVVFISGIALAEDVEGGFMHDGRYRTYLLHIPPSYNDEDSIPLVINLHGGGGDAQQQVYHSAMNPKADADGFLVCYPNGTYLPLGFTGWNAGERYNSTVDDVGFMDALIDTIRNQYTVDSLRIYATGFSNGACMCHRLACELASRIACISSVAGWLMFDDWNDCQPERLIPIIHFHSRNDPNGSYVYIDSVMRFWAERNGCEEGPDTFYNENGALRQRWSRADDSCEVIFWTTEAYEFGWPKDEVATNDEMWEFFMAHPMPVEEDEPGIQEPSATPFFSLDPASPTIFTQSAVIRFSLDQSQFVTLKFFDVSGRELTTLVDEQLDAGDHEVVIDASGLSSGVYFYRLNTPTFTKTQSISLIN